MLKRTDAPYVPGRRGKWWLKLKRELSTLDVVVVGVEWGHGRRAKVLSDYTFAVRGGDRTPARSARPTRGLTDAEIAEMTAWFLEHRLPARAPASTQRLAPREIVVEPSLVVEVAFDIIQPSDAARERLFAALSAHRAPAARQARRRDRHARARATRSTREMLEREGVAR